MGHYISRDGAADDVERGFEENYVYIHPRARGRVETNVNGIGGYLPLYKALLKGDWNEVSRFLHRNPEALTAKITIASETALHIAIGAGNSVEFVDSLIRRISRNDLSLTDQNGETALSVAAIVGKVEVAKLLVNKNPDLPNICGNFGFPVHRAAQFGQEKMIAYLFDVTYCGIERSPFTGYSGGRLLNYIITAELFDIALILVERYPDIATADGEGMESPLHVIARKSHIFPSGYDVLSSYVPFHYQSRNPAEKYYYAIELVKKLCLEILQLEDAEAFSLFELPLLTAASLGTPEIIQLIVEAFPYAIWVADEENHNIFQLAVLHRRENVFNLIYQMSDCKHLISKYIDKQGNNILHLAGKLPHQDRLTLNSRAALQVQLELQWFKEVERFVPPVLIEAKNRDGNTPWMVFTKTHQELIITGGEWMKNTASACTVASTLITTAGFGAALNVPGDHSPDGHPIFIHRWVFDAFVVAIAVSLFSSIIAILSFLSIVTCRFSVQDFIVYLPRKLINGLFMLFLSMISITLAFSLAVYLLFDSMKVAILVSMGATVVVLNLGVLLFPLLFQYYKATFSRGIFGKKNNSILH